MKEKGFVQVLKRLWKYLKPQKFSIILTVILALIGNSLLLYAPTIIGEAVGKLAEGVSDFSGLLSDVVLLGAVYLISTLLIWFCAVLSVKISTKAIFLLREEAFKKLGKLPLSTVDRGERGDFISRFTNDAETLSDGLTQFITQLFSGIITVAAALFFMLRLNVFLTLAAVIVTPLIFVVSKTVTKLSTGQFKKQQALIGNLSGYAEEHIRGLRTIKSYTSEENSFQEFSQMNGELYDVGKKAQFYSSLTNPSTRLLNYISYILIGVAGGYLAINFGISTGIVASFLTYSSVFSKPFNEFTAITTQLLSAAAAGRRIFGLLDEKAQIEDSQHPIDLQEIKGEIEFRNVCFAYNPKKPLITNFSLKVPAGSSVAIVGPTGAGKTTMVNLLMRFYEINSGEILLDGINTSNLTRENLRKSFGMVLQDSWLFEGTIRDNIAYGNKDASFEEIKTAAKAANAHGFIKRLPKGYDTKIREGGENLSVGQRQLLTIARAMLLSPPMLILDEATSSVDALTELEIQKTFLRVMKGRTSFVIAHRLSTIREADIILVMKDGSIIEQGSHDELLAQNGFYTKLFNSQFENAS